MNHPRSIGFSRHFLLVAAILAVSLGGCTESAPPAAGTAPKQAAATGTKRIILMTNGNSPFWDACRSGMQAVEKDMDLAKEGFQAVMEVNDATAQGQIDKLRQYGSQPDIVAVGISVTDAKNVAIAEEMRKLRAQGVVVVAIDSDLETHLHDARFAFLGTDNIAAGKELGKCVKKLRPDGGEFVTFVGLTGAQNAIERASGFGQGAGDKFKSVDNMGDEMDTSRARENVRNALRNHPDVKTLVGIWSYNGPAIVDVLRETDKRKETTAVTFDAEPLSIEQMNEGMIDAMLVQNPFKMGYDGVRLMKALATKDEKTIKEMYPNLGQPGGDIYDTGLKVVAPDKDTPLKASMFDKKTEFLKLADFREWLKKYGLKGS